MGSLDEIELFEYAESADAPFVTPWTGWEDAAETGEAQECASKEEIPGTVECDQRIEEEKRVAFEAGRAHGVEEGRATALQESREAEIRKVAGMVSDFEQDSSRYFQAVEQEVVKLALATAGRILRRESQTDPLLLMGSVRIALGQIAASTEVRIRVPAGDLDLWTEAIALLPNLKTKPRVVAGEGMRLGECAIETNLGRVELSIPHQMAEIERSMLNKQSIAKSSGNVDASDAEAVL